jgi:hypothetical protein
MGFIDAAYKQAIGECWPRLNATPAETWLDTVSNIPIRAFPGIGALAQQIRDE